MMISRKLTSREIDVLLLVAVGYANKEIADKLDISDKTVKTHRQNMICKYNARNITHVVYLAIRLNIID